MTERRTGGTSEPRSDGPSFFVSYARPPGSPSRDDPSPIGELVRDLNFELGQHVRQGTRQIPPGVSDREIPMGDNWRRFISHMLAEAHVLIGLVSTPYLDNDWCGKEWTVFSRRAVHARPPLSPETSAILPVVWEPVPQDRRHTVVQRLHYTNERMPGAYARDGLLALSKQAGKRYSYHQVVNQLARRVCDLLMYTTVEPGRMVDAQTAPSAFHQSKPSWDGAAFLESKAQGW